MKNVADFINEFENKLNEREAFLNNESTDLKNIESLTKSLNELDSLLADLRKEYNNSRRASKNDLGNKELKEAENKAWAEIESYLQKRVLVQAEIESAINNYKMKVLSVRKDVNADKDIAELKNLYKERNDIISRLEQMATNSLSQGNFDPYDDLSFSFSDVDKVLEAQKELKQIDDKILNLQVYLNTVLFDTQNEYIITTSTLNTAILNGDLASLNLKKEEIIAKLKLIEEMSGPKATLKYNGKQYEIRKGKDGQYKSLLHELDVVNKNITKLTHNDLIVRLDEDLLAKMDEPQKRAYLSSLLLQIENVPSSVLVEYIDGKVIPLEYKELYLKIKNMLKPKRKMSENWSIVLDPTLVEKMSNQEKLDYYSNIIERLTKLPMKDSVEITLGDKKYTVNRNDVSLMETCYERYKRVKEEMAKECALLNQELDDLTKSYEDVLDDDYKKILEEQNELTEITVDDKTVKLRGSDLKKYAENHAKIKAMQEQLQEKIIFDDEKYKAMTFDEQISYCKDLINQILLKEVKQPVNLKLDGKDISVDAFYADTMQKATEALLNIGNLDIKIDEDYVSRLNDDEKICYCRLLLHDITERDIENECHVYANNQEYTFDKKYEKLFEKINNRIEILEANKKKPAKVEKSRPAKFLDKIKRQLKKRAVQIGLGLGAMFCVGFGLGRLSNKANVKEEPAITQEVLDNAVDKAVKNAVDVENLDDIIQNAVNEALEKQRQESYDKENIQNEVTTPPATPVEETIKTPLGETFTLNSDTEIFKSYDSTKGLNPTFKQDIYTTIGVQLQLADGTIMEVDYYDQDAKKIVEELLNNGAVILARRAVANEGMNDYLANGVATGVFLEQTIIPSTATTDLQDIISNTLSQGRGL